MRYQVYCQEKHWLSSTDFPTGFETDEYDDKAVNLIAYDEEFKSVGTLRILQGKDYNKLPFISHPGLKGKQVKYPNLSEVSRFIVTSEKNKNHILKGLLRLCYHTGKKLGIDYYAFVSEPGLIRFLGRYKYYFDPICTPAKYYGGFTLAAICDMKKTESIWKKHDHQALNFYMAEASMLTT